MQRRKWIQLLALIAFGAIVSPSQATAAEETPIRKLLRVGESKSYDTGFKIKFLKVSRDRRCPADVECAHPGDATIVLRIKTGKSRARNYTLHTNKKPRKLIIPVKFPELGNVEKSYAIKIASLSPLPVSGKKTRTSAYQLDLKVSIVK